VEREFVGSSYFTASARAKEENDEDEEETADALASYEEQPNLFDFDEENLFDPDSKDEEQDGFEDDDYEQEAYCILDPSSYDNDDYDDADDNSDILNSADEEMEDGAELSTEMFHAEYSDEDDDDLAGMLNDIPDEEMEEPPVQQSKPASPFSFFSHLS
ncbi:MAG: hypothetical protein AB7D32_04070, partial [Sphaerochaeta sp.]